MDRSEGHLLRRLDAVIDWEGFRPLLEQALAKPTKRLSGRPLTTRSRCASCWSCNGISMYRMNRRSIRSVIYLCVAARRQVGRVSRGL